MMSDNHEELLAFMTIEWIQKIINKTIRSDSKLVDMDITSIGTDKGFLSVIKKLSLTWQPVNPAMPNSVVVKVPTTIQLDQFTNGSKHFRNFAQKLKSQLHLMHNSESAIYELLSTMSNPPVKMPFVFASQKMEFPESVGYLVMQDLTDCKGLDCNLLRTCNNIQFTQLLKSFGRLHAWSLKNEARTRSFIQKPINFTEALTSDSSEAKYETLAAELRTPPWDEYFNPELIETVKQFAIPAEEALKITYLNDKYGIPDVLTHGDIHTNNILFHDSGNGDIAAIIDWQCVYLGSPCIDLCRAMSMFCVSAKDNTPENRHKWLHIYYESFEIEFGRRAPFSFDQLHKCFKETFILLMRLLLPLFALQFGKTPESNNQLAVNLAKEIRDLVDDVIQEMKI